MVQALGLEGLRLTAAFKAYRHFRVFGLQGSDF